MSTDSVTDDRPDWYRQRHSLLAGMIFTDQNGEIIMLDRRTSEDDTQWEMLGQWEVLTWCGGDWVQDGYTVEPDDLHNKLEMTAGAIVASPGLDGWHITDARNLAQIVRDGLMPRVGGMSRTANERTPATYLFRDLASAEDAVMNWFGDQMAARDEDSGEAATYALLKVRIPAGAAMIDPGPSAGYEYAVLSRMQPEDISVIAHDIDAVEWRHLDRPAPSAAPSGP